MKKENKEKVKSRRLKYEPFDIRKIKAKAKGR